MHYSGVGHPQTQGKVERWQLRAAVLRQVRHSRRRIGWMPIAGNRTMFVPPPGAGDENSGSARWRPSMRRYDPRPASWEHAEGAWVRKLDCEGGLQIQGTKWHISAALRGERVQPALEGRLMIYYWQLTWSRELDPTSQRSTIVQRAGFLSSEQARKRRRLPLP